MSVGFSMKKSRCSCVNMADILPVQEHCYRSFLRRFILPPFYLCSAPGLPRDAACLPRRSAPQRIQPLPVGNTAVGGMIELAAELLLMVGQVELQRGFLQ